ncbi:hypothetical protein BC826DRAFT_1038012 [Russula brevipes]|nr:hypothetical protein BC826DRAFT_1038012 [Russula brevipes]
MMRMKIIHLIFVLCGPSACTNCSLPGLFPTNPSSSPLRQENMGTSQVVQWILQTLYSLEISMTVNIARNSRKLLARQNANCSHLNMTL